MNIEDTLQEIIDRLDRIEQQTKPVVSVPSVWNEEDWMAVADSWTTTSNPAAPGSQRPP